MHEYIKVDRDGYVGLVQLNKPPTNYFSRAMIGEIVDAYEQFANEGVRTIVLGAEGKHFCAGADFGAGEMTENRTETSRLLYRSAARLFRTALPVIAAVQGSAVGGGFGLACSADFRVASSASRFHANFSMLGFHQGFGISESLPAIVGRQQAMDLLFTSRRLNGVEAHEIGLVDRLSEPGQEHETALAYAHEIAKAGPLAVRSMKETLSSDLADRVERVLDRELSEQAILWATEDSKEAIRANLARETPNFVGR